MQKREPFHTAAFAGAREQSSIQRETFTTETARAAKDCFDVIEVTIKTPHRIRVLATQKSEKEAEAFYNIAVLRRGVEEHFFMAVPAGTYKDGDALPPSRVQ